MNKDNGHPIPYRGAHECDAFFCKNSYPAAFDNNTGLKKYFKRKYNKRLRKQEKQQLKKESDDALD